MDTIERERQMLQYSYLPSYSGTTSTITRGRSGTVPSSYTALSSNMSSSQYNNRSNISLQAENTHLIEKCETLENMVNDYTTKYKEFEMMKQREFLQKERESYSIIIL